MIKKLLRHEANVNDISESDLNCAARNRQDHLVRLLMQESMNSIESKKIVERELFVATIIEDKRKLEETISQEVEIDNTNANEETALQ